MRAMILAAGRGERMRPLTDTCPKPLLEVGGRPLIEYTLERLACAGYERAVINLAHLGGQIRARLGDHYHGLTIDYSPEPPGALETAGGIRHALPLLGEDPFLVVNGDVWCDHPLTPPPHLAETAGALAHLVLVANPAHHSEGDFGLSDGHVCEDTGVRHTFAGIGWYVPALFRDLAPGPRPLAPILREAIRARRVTGEYHAGVWHDIGTPERLNALDAVLHTQDQGLI
ncbi:MAG: N-acetylmuramate alpha-1-phosphate uridylyltransferase MurU [Pseudomonadota bacterium]